MPRDATLQGHARIFAALREASLTGTGGGEAKKCHPLGIQVSKGGGVSLTRRGVAGRGRRRLPEKPTLLAGGTCALS